MGVFVGAADGAAEVHLRLAHKLVTQSVASTHILPIAHGWQVVPPQSMSVSKRFWI